MKTCARSGCHRLAAEPHVSGVSTAAVFCSRCWALMYYPARRRVQALALQGMPSREPGWVDEYSEAVGTAAVQLEGRRPLVVLDHLSTAGRLKKEGHVDRVLSAMVGPRRAMWSAFDGAAPSTHPSNQHLGEVRQGVISHDLYFQLYAALLQSRRYSSSFAPGVLMSGDTRRWYERRQLWHSQPVRDHDALVCTCARPGSPKRTHSCHLEVLAPVLVQAGWDVQLYDRHLTEDGDQVAELREGVLLPFAPVLA